MVIQFHLSIIYIVLMSFGRMGIRLLHLKILNKGLDIH